MGAPMQPRPPKKKADMEKPSKVARNIALIVAAVGLAALLAMIALFMIFPYTRNFKGAAEEGYVEATTVEETDTSDGATSDDSSDAADDSAKEE